MRRTNLSGSSAVLHPVTAPLADTRRGAMAAASFQSMTSRDDEHSPTPWDHAVPAGAAPQPARRPPYRPPVGIPAAIPETRTWRGALASILLHGLIVALLLVPLAAPQLLPEMLQQGAGGPGPAGGGGGGTRGSGGEKLEERVRYIEVKPAAPSATPSIVPPVPVEEKKPDVKPPLPIVDLKTDVKLPDLASVSVVRGTGGGTGNDGTAGSGPGSGGGVGSGVGTGRGSSVGPGTGGGPGTVYPPQVINANFGALMGLPQKLKPYVAVAYFDVDEKGNGTLIAIQPPLRDRGWRRKLEEALGEYKFRAATRWDGTPVRDTTTVTIEAP